MVTTSRSLELMGAIAKAIGIDTAAFPIQKIVIEMGVKSLVRIYVQGCATNEMKLAEKLTTVLEEIKPQVTAVKCDVDERGNVVTHGR